MTVQIEIHCGIEKLGQEVATALGSRGVISGSHFRSERRLVIDAPWGWALSKQASSIIKKAVIVTDNPCPEYRLDILGQNPEALLSKASIADIVQALTLSTTGDLYPYITSPLTLGERRILRLSAKGLRNKKIAQARRISVGRVKNILTNIYQKLYLNSQAQLTLYYFGSWHALSEEGWKPPRHVRDQNNVTFDT